jgi:transcription antitermination factor NusG
MATKLTFAVGDTVELRDAPFDTVGTVVAIVRPEHVKVEWNTGEGYMGKTTMLSVRALRRRAAD